MTNPPVTKTEIPVRAGIPSKLIFDDEFEGSAGASPSPARWGFDTGGGGWGNNELESYTSRPTNAALDGNGDLSVTARREGFTGADGIPRNYTSARLQTLGTFNFQYGTVEARIKVPQGQGLVAQFWALGGEAYEYEAAWPGCGEIDTMEVLGSQPNFVRGHVHGPWQWAPNNGLGASHNALASLAGGFHTYATHWAPGQVSFLLDGRAYETVTRDELPSGARWPFEHPFFLLMDLAVGGEWPGAPNASTQFPAQMQVDWVRVWQ